MMLVVYAAWTLVAGLVAPQPGPLPVSGANLAGECQFPGVVSFRAGENLCTGTMAHPQVMVTAAHCLEGGDPGTVHFGQTHNPYERKIDVERCLAYPDFAETDTTADDLGFCVLATPATELAAVPLVTECELGNLEEGRVAVIVGYGVPDEEGNFGRKRYAFTTLASGVRSDGSVLVGDAGANGCLGDSGGPALIQLDDGSWRAIGVLSRGPGCGKGPDAYRALADRIAWLEQESGFDLSPCHGEDGQWSPSSGCAELDADPRIAGAGWDAFCDGPRMVPSSSCEMIASESSSSGGESSSSSTTAADTSSTTIAEAAPTSTGCGCRASDEPPFAVLAWLLACVAGRRPRP
ncbi:MAG TPA: S1 family peptidase [Nannocystaceae bacterium]|nr:S1 family peptidase [Nannocystaceae bacterium]